MHSKIIKFIIFFLIGTNYPLAQSSQYNIKDYGATGNRNDKATQAIQKAIDLCHAAGGGTVYVPSGTFVTDTIYLKSHVHFHLDAGAELLGSPDTADYRMQGRMHGIIYAENAEHITISGAGSINGNGTHFMNLSQSHIASDFERKYTR